MPKWTTLLFITAFGLAACTSTPKQGSSNVNLLKYVPEDTAIFIQTKEEAELLEIMKDHPLLDLSNTETAKLKNLLLKNSNKEQAQPFNLFWESLTDSIFNGKAHTTGNFYKGLGIKSDAHTVIYLDGLWPVLKVELNDSSSAETALNKASQASGLTPTETQIGDAVIKTWALPNNNYTNPLSVAASTHNNILTLTLFSQSDSEEAKKQRLGLASIPNSIAQSPKLKNLSDQYGLLGNYTSFIDLNQIAQAYLNPETSPMGKDILSLLPDSAKQKIKNPASANCKKDISTIFSAMPRLVFGYSDLSVSKKRANASLVAALEINNPSLVSSLKLLNGHIPSHVTHADNSILSVGLGLDAQNLASILTQLHSQFISAPFTCPALVKSQENLKPRSPAVVGMFTGLAQSVKGVGISLLDLPLNKKMGIPDNVSALISIATNDPTTLASYANILLPASLKSLKIPADGTPVDIALPNIPPSIKVKAAIKGNFIVLYTGKEGEKAAKALAKETLTTNGVYGLSANYNKLGALIGLLPSENYDACLDNQELKNQLSGSEVNINALMTIADKGIPLTGNISIGEYKHINFALNGTYTLSEFTQTCSLETLGFMTFNSDGTGNETQTSTDNKCNLSETAFKWNHNGNNSITFESTQNKERFNCNQPFNEGENTTETCYIMNETAQSFQCMFDAGTPDAYLIHLTK